MEDEQLQPTIENPFATPERVFKPAKRGEVQPIRRRGDTPPAQQFYDPGYFVSQATKTFIQKKIEEQVLVAEEIPTIYDIGKLIGRIFTRQSPTLSDLQAAVEFKSFERVQQVANGEEKVTIIRHDTKNGEVMPEKERIKFWKQVAVRILQERDAATSPQPPLAS